MTEETELKILLELQNVRQELTCIKQSQNMELLTIKDICELTKVTAKHIHALTKKGAFPGQIKIGNSSRWKRAEIEDYFNGNWKNRTAQ